MGIRDKTSSSSDRLAELVLKPLLIQLKWAVSHDPYPDQMTRNIAEFTAEAEKGLAALTERAASPTMPALDDAREPRAETLGGLWTPK